MKPSGGLFGALAVAMLLSCAGPARAQTDVTFPDPNLEAAVRSELGKPTGALTSTDLGALTTLLANSCRITNLSGLEYATNLTTLSLYYDALSDVTPLSGLGKLRYLYLPGNHLGDGHSLSNLSQLFVLDIRSTGIQDAAPLLALTNLEYLYLDSNPLINPAVLGGLTNLETLDAEFCSLSNLDFVGSLSRLNSLDLRGNRLTNISALQDLPALNSVSLDQNFLDVSAGSPALTIITNLQARGVWVYYQPQNQPPVIGVPANWTVPTDRATSLSFDVSDDLTSADQVVVTAVSASTNLLPEAGVVLQHAYYSTWTLTLTPQAGQTGTGTITLSATDDTGLTATTNITVTVACFPTVSIPDPSLEAAIRGTLNLPTGPLTTYDLQSLTSLSASTYGPNAAITNLAGLEWATNLASLYLSGNAIASLGPLLALPQLQTLDLGYNNLRDVAALQGLTSLSRLTLDGNAVTDLSPLAGLPNLATLSASSCALSNLAGIGALAHLQQVSLGNNGLRDPSPLASLANLTYLDLQGNPLAGTAGLAGLLKLTSLSLASCSLSDLSSLQGLTNLQYLALSHNSVRDLSPLAGLASLTSLDLGSNPLISLASLGALPRLASLTLADCHLAGLPSLQGFPALQFLSLANNEIRDLTPLAGLTKLASLDLTGNALTNLTPLGGLPALSALDLSSCSLGNLSSLTGLTQLRSLNLAYDHIADISALSGLTNLYGLYLTANRLTNINGLEPLSGLGSLDLTRNLLDLSAGSPAMTAITNLQKQGASVNYDPQNQPPIFSGLRTNWVMRPNTPADLQFALYDDVTLADQVAVTIACASAGPLSNSAVTLLRTSFRNSPGPRQPLPGFPIVIRPPVIIQPPIVLPPPIRIPPALPVSGVAAAKSGLIQPFPLLPYGYGGGVSYWDLTVTPTPNQTGTMTLTLTATDDTGLSTNVMILVTVAAPQGLDGAVLGATNLAWQTGGNAPWFGQTNVSHSGSAAAQSGPVGVNEESWLETTVTGPGILTFWWGIGSASWGTEVSFTTSRGGSLSLPGGNGWRRESVSLPAGESVLDWSYQNFWAGFPTNSAWLDQVSFVPTLPDFWVELATGPALPGSRVTLHGEPGGLYELQVSTNLSAWSSLSTVVLDPVTNGFTASVADASAPAGARFYRALQLPAGTMWFGPVTSDAGGSPVLRLYCQPATVCEIQASTDLRAWSPLATVTNTTGTATFTDSQKGLAQRFYKARQLP